jgi:hypothetical protein
MSLLPRRRKQDHRPMVPGGWKAASSDSRKIKLGNREGKYTTVQFKGVYLFQTII